MRARAIAGLLSAGFLPAQTFVVDASNGPGTQFTSIATAVSAVPDGATLLVRRGAYQPFRIVGKGLRILADAGTSVSGTTIVSATRPNQPVTLSRLDFTAVTPGTGVVLELYDCAGSVVLAELTTPPALPAVPSLGPFWVFARGLVARRCSQLIIRSCTFTGGSLSDSTSIVESCTFRGMSGGGSPTGQPVGATEGLIVGGSVQFSGVTQLIGGDGLVGFNDAPGLSAILADVTMRSGTIRSGSGVGATGSPAILMASARVRIDPTVVVIGSATSPLFGVPTVVAMPEVTSSSAPLGGAIRASVATAAGDAVLLLVGRLGPPVAVPGLPEPFWLNPAQVFVHAFGVQQPGSPVVGSVPVPNTMGLRGSSAVWQAVILGPAAFAVTNPSLALVR